MLRLRPYKPCDAEKIVSWTGDEISFRKWCADRYDKYPITADDMNRHYRQYDYEENFFPMTAFDESGVVGHLIIRFTDSKKTVARFGFIIVDSTKRGMGCGRQMLELAVKYTLEILRADKITLGVFDNNPSAYACYKSVGFKEKADTEKVCYRIMDEDWLCSELEMLPN